jgi:DNA (cytosine-5)-methyltransferase 1
MIATMQLVLSLFPGVDLFGRGFEAEGFCVVRGPDKLWGGDICDFVPVCGRFDGVIGGSPCVDYSKLRRGKDSGISDAMLAQFLRVVVQAWPRWFVLENVPGVPSVAVAGYAVQRVDLAANEFGLPQRRIRHFQLGFRDCAGVAIDRRVTCRASEPAVVASEGSRVTGRRSFSQLCALQGVTELELPAFTLSWRNRVVGNGVPLPMARAVARAVRDRGIVTDQVVCGCGCGRVVTGRRSFAGPSCRKRAERARRGLVTVRGVLSIDRSRGLGVVSSVTAHV